MSTSGPALSLKGVSKTFGAVQALRDVSIDCLPGEIHALVGENGSGKSTLLGIASGFLAPDRGTVEIDGRPLGRASPAKARALGLGIAYQDYSHVLDLTVAENLYLAVPPDDRPPHHELVAWASGLLAPFGIAVDPTATARSLVLAQRQMFEVVKALLTRPRVLLLDEPTTALGPQEVERFHQLVLEHAKADVAIVYVSHRLPEILSVADRLTVLRDGVGQGTYDAADVTEESVVAMMIGRPLTVAFPERRHPGDEAEVLLEVTGLAGERFGPVDLRVRRGEVVGIAGAEGNGQLPLLRALAGIETATGGAACDGAAVDMRSPVGPLRAGVVLLSGDRRGEALFPVLSVRANATVQVLRRLARGGLVKRSQERQAIAGLVGRLRVRMGSAEQPIQSLSGGNQQKVSLMRPFLRGDVKVILAEEPTQGVDVGARFDIYEALHAKAEEGVAIVIKSSDPLELAGLCDRVLVMSRGRIVEEIPAADLSERRIVEAIVGSVA
jgi:ribose transport system ATP-binding protein